MEELWLPIPEWEVYEGVYEASDQGRIRSLDRIVWRRSQRGNLYPWTRPGRIMKQWRIPDSPKTYRRYWQVTLTGTDGIQRHHHVHLLIARTFLGPRPEGQQTRHGPAGILVNSRANLSYGTAEENQADRIRDGTSNRGSRNPMSKLTESQVDSIRLRHEAGERQVDLANELGVSKATISQILSGKSWTNRD